jgi:regulator of protease activity HflC (stomatin/prohibitin superfamily)
MFYQKFPDPKDQIIFKWIERVVAIILLLWLFFASTQIIQAGDRGVVLRLGSVNRVLDEGFHFTIPFIEKVKTLNVQTQKEQVAANSASKDLQTVSTTVALNYNLNPHEVGLLWQNIGSQYKERLIDPAIQEAVKAATAKFTAEQLVTQRSAVRDEIKNNLTERLKAEYISVSDVSIVNFEFSQAFDQAIEAKVTAEQNALAAKNKLEQIKFEADQRIAQAQGEAEAIRIQAEAIQNQGGAEYVNLKAIEKWSGALPTYMMGDSVPFINIK